MTEGPKKNRQEHRQPLCVVFVEFLSERPFSIHQLKDSYVEIHYHHCRRLRIEGPRCLVGCKGSHSEKERVRLCWSLECDFDYVEK